MRRNCRRHLRDGERLIYDRERRAKRFVSTALTAESFCVESGLPGRQRRLAGDDSAIRADSCPLLKGNVSGASFCVVCCVWHDNNDEIGDVTTAGKRPVAHPGRCLPPREKKHRSDRCAYRTGLLCAFILFVLVRSWCRDAEVLCTSTGTFSRDLFFFGGMSHVLVGPVEEHRVICDMRALGGQVTKL